MYNLGTRDTPLNRDILSIMLEQRRAQQKGYITLKEAAEISNYTPDYVGQLIRAGKIKGEQVYSNVAWVTTTDEIEAYLHNKNRSVGADEGVTALPAVKPYFKFGLYALIGLLAAVLLVLQYIFYVSLDRQFSHTIQDRVGVVEIIPNESLVYE